MHVFGKFRFSHTVFTKADVAVGAACGSVVFVEQRAFVYSIALIIRYTVYIEYNISADSIRVHVLQICAWPVVDFELFKSDSWLSFRR